jgi:DNA-binding SARP family transcriptional activator
MLHVHVLGAPHLSWDETPLTIARRIPRAILYYLAVEGGPVSRSSFQVMFWPDEPDKVSRARLRDNLTKLRAALPDSNLLQAMDDVVVLEPDQVRVDLHAFNNLLEGAGQIPWQLSPAKPLPAPVYQALSTAAKLWRGPGFMAGMNWPESSSLDDWVHIQQADFERKFHNVLNRLIDHERVLGNLERVIDWVLMALRLDNLDEDLHQVLLKTYLNLNRRNEAQKHYKELENLYYHELNVELPDSIRQLRDQTFDTQPSKDYLQPLEWSTHTNILTPFVGREELIERLNNFCSTSSGVVLFGEAGVGKTRLVQECYQRRETKPRLLMITGHSTGSNLPYYAWIHMLRRTVTQEEWLRLSPTWAASLAVILPELKEIHPELQTQELPYHPRTVLLEAVHQLLRILADGNPLTLFVDDVHWLDESSLAIMSYLLQGTFFNNERNFLVMAARTEELNPWLDTLLLKTPSKELRQVELPSLETGDVAHLIQYVLGQSPSQEFTDRLTRETGGNPLMVLETLQEMLQRGTVRNMEEIMHIPLAPGVHQLIQKRMHTLSNLALEVLSIGALLGAEFDLSLLLEIIKEDTVDVLEALVELEVARLVHSNQQDSQIKYSFSHDKIRESILFDISPARKRVLHAKIAHALEQYLGDQAISQAARIAYHYQESGNLLKAFDYWVQAAQYAYRLFSVREATDAFSKAERIITREPGLTDEQLHHLYKNWSEMAFENDDPETLIRINETLLSLGQERNSDLLVGVAYDGLSDAYFASNQFEEGLSLVLAAIPYLENAGNLFEILSSQMHQGTLLYMAGKLSEAREILYNTLEQLPNELDPNFKKLNAYLHYQIGTLEALRGYPFRSIEFLQRAIGPTQAILPPSAVFLIYAAMGLANYIKGDFKTGYDFSCKAIELGEKLEYQRILGYAHAYAALSSHNLGMLDKAWGHANRALYIGQTYNHFEISALAYRTFGNTYMRLEDYHSAIEYFNKGIQIAGEHYVTLELMALMGYSLASAGQVEEGHKHLTNAYETAAQLELGSISVYARSLLFSNQSQHNTKYSSLLKKIEQASIDTKNRSINKAHVMLKAPFMQLGQSTEDFIEQANEGLKEASQMPDLLLEARILRDLIIFKKSRGLPWQLEVDRLNTILEELAPRADGMPFEKAWQRYHDSMRAIENA